MNHPIEKPMLASKCERLDTLRFPLLATPKLDGIRCLKVNGRALTRSFKPVSNRFIREWIETNLPDGLDGELIVKGTSFNETAGCVGRRSGEPNFTFAIFDYVQSSLAEPYCDRMRSLASLPDSKHIHKILPKEVANLAELVEYEEHCIREGYEGVMIRTPFSPYKCGRSTVREGYLLKIKRFEDAEAIVIDTYEGMSNLNPAEKDTFGRTKRSHAQAGMIGRGELGGFLVRHAVTGVEFRVGYNHVLGGIDRVTLWERRESLKGKLIKFSHQPSGSKDAPRFPKFIGFREAWDL